MHRIVLLLMEWNHPCAPLCSHARMNFHRPHSNNVLCTNNIHIRIRNCTIILMCVGKLLFLHFAVSMNARILHTTRMPEYYSTKWNFSYFSYFCSSSDYELNKLKRVGITFIKELVTNLMGFFIL